MIRWERWSLGLSWLLAGCNNCHEDTKAIRWTGEVVYPEYTSGQVQLVASEELSQRCGDDHNLLQTPGMIIARTVLDRPGPFVLNGETRGIDGVFSDINLTACLTNGEAGTWVKLPPNDVANLSLLLKPNQCVVLL